MEAEDEEKEYSKNIVKETEDYASQMKSILEQEQGEEDKQPQEASGSRQIEETSKLREPDRTVEQTSMQQPSTKGNVEPESVEEKSEIVENKPESV